MSLSSLASVIENLQIDKGSRLQTDRHVAINMHQASVNFLRIYLENRFATHNEHTEFLTDVLHRSQELNLRHDIGVGRYRMGQIVVAVYRRYHPQAESTGVGGEIRSNIDRNFSFLKSLPPKFFQALKPRLRADNWALNDELKSESASNHNVAQPLKTLVHDEVLQQFWARQNDDKARLSAAHLLFLVGCSLDDYHPRREDRKMAVLHTKEQINKQTEAIIDSLSEPPLFFWDSLKPYLGQLQGLANNIGAIHLAREGKGTSVLYLESDDQYMHAFEVLGVGQQTEIIQAGPVWFERIRAGERLLDPNDVLIVDYEVAEAVARETSRKAQAGALFSLRKKPCILVSLRDPENPKLRLQWSHSSLNINKTSCTFDELVGVVAPSLAPKSGQFPNDDARLQEQLWTTEAMPNS